MNEVWTKWEGEVISGAFPLRRFLCSTDHSGVFLTQDTAQKIANVAIKIIPIDPAHSVAQLSHWRTAANLSHPHLIRLFETGLCQLGGQQFLFVVMEFAEENLAQILPSRALSADEARDMLIPVLDALTFLHRKNLVHGQLKPANILVVDDQLKLASDTIRPAAEPRASIVNSSLYDPPEAKDGRITAAGDIWALGVTLVEALTQRPPTWPDERSETVSLPPSFPPALLDTVRRCLSRNPAERPTISDLDAQFKRATQPTAPSSPQAVVAESTARTAAAPKLPKPRVWVSTVVALLLILAAVWTGVRLLQGSPGPRQGAPSIASSTKSAETSPAPLLPAPRPPERPAQPLADSPPVIYKEIPNVPRSASSTIHGHINVIVRVNVDGSGKVVDETLELAGPSKYFSGLASAAARKWRFAPTDNQNSRAWLLWFDFSRDGTSGHATAPRS